MAPAFSISRLIIRSPMILSISLRARGDIPRRGGYNAGALADMVRQAPAGFFPPAVFANRQSP